MVLPQAVLAVLLVINEILNAGDAITAFSLLLYSLTFNLRERVARAFALLLACVVLGHFGDVLVSTAYSQTELALWLRMQWLAIGLLPAAYMHLTDALLAATGRPSRGRRGMAVRIGYVVGAALAVAVGLGDGVVDGVAQQASAAYLRPGPLFYLYTVFLTASLIISGRNLYRAYLRCLTRTSRRRMVYLMLGAVGPVLSIFPFLTFAGPLMLAVPVLFWSVQILTNIYVAGSLVLMAYSVAYFGVSYPDRVVKSRLFQWILRGPVVASTVLAVMVLVNRAASLFGLEQSRLVPFAMVASLLLLQLLITLIRPPIERWLFYGEDRIEVARLHLLEERLLTSGDLRQFLESILNAVCDIHRTPSAFFAVVGPNGLDLEVAVGSPKYGAGGVDMRAPLCAEPIAVGPAVVEWAADMYVSALYSMPMVAMVPLIVLWFGFRVPAKVIIVFLFMVFPILLNTYQGVKDVDRNLQEVARSFCSSERQLWRHLIIPSAIPFIVVGIRLAIGRGLVGMIVAEFYTSVTGLGYMIVRYANAFETDKLFVPIVVVMVLGVGLMWLAKSVEGRIAPWRNFDEKN